MSEVVHRRTQGAAARVDLSQVMAHGPALCAANMRFWGAVLMLFAIAKTGRGPLGYAALGSVAASIIYAILRTPV